MEVDRCLLSNFKAFTLDPAIVLQMPWISRLRDNVVATSGRAAGYGGDDDRKSHGSFI